MASRDGSPTPVPLRCADAGGAKTDRATLAIDQCGLAAGRCANAKIITSMIATSANDAL
jgi:hypothetical protein